MTFRDKVYTLYWKPYSRLNFTNHPLLKEHHEQECREKTNDILELFRDLIITMQDEISNEDRDDEELVITKHWYIKKDRMDLLEELKQRVLEGEINE